MSKKQSYFKIFKEIAEMQFELNNFTAGNGWDISNINVKTNKAINWNRASWLEMAEFVMSFDWKHWKKDPEDIENAKVELVDILHFATSQLIRDKVLSLQEDNKDASINYDDIFVEIAEEYATSFKNVIEFKEYECFDIYYYADKFVKFAAGESSFSAKAMFNFVSLCVKLELMPEDLYKGYMIKNILNQFRQNNGYKDGSYKKVWTQDDMEAEDNVFAVKCAEQLLLNNESIKENLYLELEKIYKK